MATDGRPPAFHPRLQSGFTLVELVMAIVLTGILATVAAQFIVEPSRAYVDQSRRAALVDAADIALRRMGREIRAAVPNSIRTPDAQTLQFWNVVSGGRYRAAAPPQDPAAILEFDRADDSFDVPGGFPGVATLASSSDQLVIYNLGSSGSDLYEGSAAARPVITPAGTTVAIAGDRVTLSPAFQFGWQSPEQRIFLTDGQVDYACSGSTLTRNGAVVTDHVDSCSFSYTAGTATRSALATLQLTLSRDGESVTLLREVHVENLP